MGPYHHPIATENPEAQRFFDQGLILLYAFNREEAARSFGRAAELDAKSPMPRWGVAMAFGPHVNMDSDLDVDRKASCAAAAQARSLANSASVHERELVEALWARCSDLTIDPKKLDAAYTESMRRLAHRYP